MDAKKLMRQIQKDPKMFQKIKEMQNIATNSIDSNLTPAERLRERMNSLKGKRITSQSKEINKSRKLEHEKALLKKNLEENDKKFNAETILNTEVSNIKKNKKSNLKKLNKRYGTITEDDYTNALIYLNNEELNNNNKDLFNRNRNIVNVYLSQQQNKSLNTINLDDE